jgi:hypothetical protein
MRTDVLADKKCVHVKLDKATHMSLRSKLFKHNISMQDLFEECARLVATETTRGQALVDSIVARKIKEAITGIKKRNESKIDDLDVDTLYNMINGNSEFK